MSSLRPCAIARTQAGTTQNSASGAARPRKGAPTEAAREPEPEWWKLNLAVRDFLRANADVARNYASAKWHAVSNGADMLLAYSDAKRVVIEMIVAEARARVAARLIPAPSQVAQAPVPAPP